MLFKLFWILLSLLDCGVKICCKPCQAKPARCTCLLYCGAAIFAVAVEAAGVVADFSSSTVVCFCVLLFVAVLYAVIVAHFVLLQSMMLLLLLLINASIVGQVMLICNLTQ